MDNLEFPRCMYRHGGTWQLESGLFTIQTVQDADEMEAAKKDGFHLDQYAALDAAKLAEQGDNRAPTREELEAKATELGIAFKPQTSNKKLSADIAAKLAEQGEQPEKGE
jgi:hypothetical protein